MDEFKPAVLNMPPVKEFIKSHMETWGLTRAEAKFQYNLMKQQEIYVNDTYQVNVKVIDSKAFGQKIKHLSIKRRDKEPIHDWRDLQEIKNQITCEECEAIELYPSQDRVVDTANQYHLWVFPIGVKIPIGYTEGEICYESKGGTVQRPLNQD